MEQNPKPKSITILGVFKDNKITNSETGEVTNCITYGRVRKEIEGKLAYLHLLLNAYGDYYISSYILVD